jgi:ABC-type uncharacterized transport system permease subunit
MSELRELHSTKAAERPRSVDWLSFILNLTPLWAVVIALLSGAGFILAIGLDPIHAYAGLWDGAFGTVNSIGVTINQATPLILTGLGVLFAFRCGVWNIGAEGQLYMGAAAATAVALQVKGLPAIFHLPVTLLVGFLAGALWGAIPGWLRGVRGVNEVISTLMMNYIAINFVSWLVRGPLQETTRYYPQSDLLPESAILPVILPGSPLHAGIIVALAAAAASHFILWNTTLGFRLRAVGANPFAARYAGLDVAKNVMLAMVISGGLAGLAGAGEILGVQGRLRDTFSPGFGYDGIVVALLGQLQPVGVLLASLFFGSLRSGASMMQRTAQVPVTLVYVIQGLTVLLVVGSYGVRAWAYWRRKKREEVRQVVALSER